MHSSSVGPYERARSGLGKALGTKSVNRAQPTIHNLLINCSLIARQFFHAHCARARSTKVRISSSPFLSSRLSNNLKHSPDDGVVTQNNERSQASSSFTQIFPSGTGQRGPDSPTLRKGTDVPPLVEQSNSPIWGI